MIGAALSLGSVCDFIVPILTCFCVVEIDSTGLQRPSRHLRLVHGVDDPSFVRPLRVIGLRFLGWARRLVRKSLIARFSNWPRTDLWVGQTFCSTASFNSSELSERFDV
jgi:hypothetical protein